MPSGTIKINTTTGDKTIPVRDVSFAIKDKSGNVLCNGMTNVNGESEVFTLDAPSALSTQRPEVGVRHYSVYDVWLAKPNFATMHYYDVKIFEKIETILAVDMVPLTAGEEDDYVFIIPPPLAELPTPPQLQIGVNSVYAGNARQLSVLAADSAQPSPRTLPEVVVPDYITVHLGTPGNTSAQNVRVRFIDYVKNVTSSEIYPTWPENAIIANVHCIVTFALNRVYTEWYRARGFNFDITNSTSVDQYFVYGREIYQNISQIVDGIFNVYARRQGFRNPYFTEYCNGTTATCKGLSQWGTVTLANRGFTPINILHNFYPNDLQLTEGRSGSVTESYPGTPLAQGSSGAAVRRIQLQLNRISANFPLIPQIVNPNGYFGADTQAAVRVFQRSFNLVQDGIIGRSTWNKVSQVFTAITKLAELGGEGERMGLGPEPPTSIIRQGSRGVDVIHAQFLLEYIAHFYADIPATIMDTVFGAGTREAVKAFQRRFGLTADGIVGPATWRKLYEVFALVQGQTPTLPAPTPTLPKPPPFEGYVLQRGSFGPAVQTLQALLNNARILYSAVPLVTTDGVFGLQTENSVKIFQRYAGLTPDGIVGPLTWAALSAII